MLIEILKRTPLWVFALFFALLALGYLQSKGRTVSRRSISILPAAMILLSIFGVYSAFGISPAGFALWLLGAALAVGAGAKLARPKGVIFDAATQSFYVPGSWFPLIFMMAIFFIKFGVGVNLARQLPVANDRAFVGMVSLCYGLLSGAFLARVMVVWRSASK